MFEEMQRSIVDQHMDALTRQAAEARTAASVTAGRPSLRARLARAVASMGTAITGRTRTVAEHPAAAPRRLTDEPRPDAVRPDVARAA